MKNIKLEITEEDIKEYLNKYKNFYKYCEPLFIKYLKDSKNTLNVEILEILTKGKAVFEGELPSFDSEPTMVRNLDLSGLCHILIPTLKYYGQSQISIDQLYGKLEGTADLLTVPIVKPLDIVLNTIDDYRICDKVDVIGKIVNIKMGREHCRGELLTYQSFYDENKIKKIKKIVKEGMK